MTALTRIEINPNLRVDGDCTIADLVDDVYGERPNVFATVEVFESASGLQGRGWVTEIDEHEKTVTLIVDWANLTVPVTQSSGAVGNFYIRDVETGSHQAEELI